MKEFFDGIHGLGFWQWVGLILVAQTIRGGTFIKIPRART